MNSKPHTHDITVNDLGGSWSILYGDQQKDVAKPIFRNPKTVLENAIKNIINKHDEQSVLAQRRSEDADRDKRMTLEVIDSIRGKVNDHTPIIDCPDGHDDYVYEMGMPISMNGVPLPKKGNVKTHKGCGTCNGTGKVPQRWPSDALKVGE